MITAYCIVDKETGRRWSRNRWATPTTLPDLYATQKNAQAQIDTGKISLMKRNYEWCNPEIKEIQIVGLEE